MLFEFNRFSSLLLIFFINGIVYSILLYRKSRISEAKHDKWLSLFLILCTLYFTPWMVGFAGWYDTQPYRDFLFYVPFQHLYLIGPVIFFYTQSLLNPSFSFTKKNWLHLLPGILYLIYTIVIFITDKVVLKKYYFLANGEDPDFDNWYQLTGLLSMFIYLVLSLRYYLLYKKWIVQIVSYADNVMFRWIRNFLLAFLVMLVVRSAFLITGFFINLDYWSTWWYFLVFGIISYYIAVTGYANSIQSKVNFKFNLLKQHAPLLLTDRHSITEDAELIEIIVDDGEPGEPVSGLRDVLLELIVTKKLYGDPELSLTALAKQLGTTAAVVSKTINREFKLNFNDFINGFRVNAVKEKIGKGEHIKQTLLAIAFDCGFNSKATFNRAFRKATGVSPREYIQALVPKDQI